MISCEDASVIGIGSRSIPFLIEALKDGAKLVEVVKADENDEIDLMKLVGVPGSVGIVQYRSRVAGNLEESGEWELCVAPDGVTPEVNRLIVPGGAIVSGKSVDLSEQVTTKVERCCDQTSATVLHVHNVQRCGGTGNFVYDFACCFPEWNHIALCVNDPRGDQNWINDVSSVMRPLYAPKLSEALLEEFDPAVVVLHATAGTSLDGEWPYDWLRDGGRRYVIAVHHVPTFPILPADLDVFVSNHVQARYDQFFNRMKRHVVIPPCVNAAAHAELELAPWGFKATTGGKGCDELREVVKNLPEWQFEFTPPGRVGCMPDHFARFPVVVVWSGLQETWCRTVTEAMASGCLVLAHRAGAIPEQITVGETGFLFDDGMGLVKTLAYVAKLGAGRALKIRLAARKWALENAGFRTMRERYFPHLIEAALRR